MASGTHASGLLSSFAGGRGEPAERSSAQVARRDDGGRKRPTADRYTDRDGNTSDVDTTVAQVRDLRERLARLDSDNRDLTNQVAQTNQLLQVERDQKRLMQQQLAEAGLRLKDISVAREDAERRAVERFAGQLAEELNLKRVTWRDPSAGRLLGFERTAAFRRGSAAA